MELTVILASLITMELLVPTSAEKLPNTNVIIQDTKTARTTTIHSDNVIFSVSQFQDSTNAVTKGIKFV